jgi:hypothetical protein
MAARFEQVITGAGATYTIPVSTVRGQDIVVFINPDGGCALLADIIFQYDETPANGVVVTYYWGQNITGGAFVIRLDADYNSIDVNDPFLEQAQGVQLTHLSQTAAGTDGVGVAWLIALEGDTISGTVLADASLTLASFPALTRGSLWTGSASARPSEFALGASATLLQSDGTDPVWNPVTGDIAITNAGVTSIAAGVIVNADINASAAIAVSKLAALTASQVVTTTAGGVLTTAATLSATLGGTGLDNSAATGFPIWTAGTQSVGSISEVITLMVSFEAAGGTQASVGDFKIKMPYAGTVTEIYAYATKAIAATDNGTIVSKNNGGTTMTDGTVTFTASDARGTAYTTTPSANNTFAAGDLLTFTTAKATAGGIVQLSITVTRTS